MEEVLKDIFVLGLVALWFGGAFALLDRLRTREFDYVRRFPPVEGARLETFIGGNPFRLGGNPFGPVARAISQVAREPQEDHELERLRRAALASSRQLALWVFGFPLFTLGVVALLILAGWVHPH